MRPLHVLAAPDKFRGTLSAPAVADAIAAAVAARGGSVRTLPLADGGEGMLDAFGGANRWTTVTGPAGRPVEAGWRMTAAGDAVIEMALASGLVLAGGAECNDPWGATTRGTGELILAATGEGAERVIVGLGGSATTDGGEGALDVLLRDPRWNPSQRSQPHPPLLVCCDVQTTFLDAAEVFGPQKGADESTVRLLRQRLGRTADRYRAEFGLDVVDIPGAGAAGGLAGGLAAVGGELLPGFDVVAAAVDLDHALRDADLVVTGEGRIDAASFHGKVVGSVASRAARQGIRTVAVVGAADEVESMPITVLSLAQRFGLEDAMTYTSSCVTRIVLEFLDEAFGPRSD
jgi:glycerate 2-kinase